MEMAKKLSPEDAYQMIKDELKEVKKCRKLFNTGAKLMSQPRQKDPSDPLYDPNDKWNEYKVDLHCNEDTLT